MATQQIAYDRVYRSHDAVIAGVCAGIAERHDFDPIAIRVLAILIAICTFGLGAVAYVLLWAYLPLQSDSSAPYEITPERAESVARGNIDQPLSVDGEIARDAGEPERLSIVARLAIAAGLMVLFLVVAMNVAPIVSGTRWWQFWPIAFLIAGLCLIVIPVPSKYASAWHAVGIVVMSLGATLLPISLGVTSWETFPYAFSRLWVLLVAAVVLFIVGVVRRLDVLVFAGAFCVAAFCITALLLFSVPGDVETLLIYMPDGRELRIALSGL